MTRTGPDAHAAYSARFANLDEICPADLTFNREFDKLLLQAVARGQELSRPEVEKLFPDAAWDY